MVEPPDPDPDARAASGVSASSLRANSPRSDSRALERLSRVARRQFGVVTTQQASGAGVTSAVLRVLVARGVLVRRFRGVYAFVATPDSREARWLAAQFAIGRSGILSHTTAAAVHGLPVDGTDHGIHVTVPRRSRTIPAGVVVHESPDTEVPTALRRGVLRVTSVARTLCDVAGVDRVADPALRRVVAAAVRSGQVSVLEVRREVAVRARFPGRAALRRALDELSPLEAEARGELESLFLRVTTRGGVPPTAMNHRVTDADGRTRYLDAVWLPEGVYAELDSRRFHGTLVDWHDDQRRENAVSLAGFPICLRFSWWDLQHHPESVIDTVRRALATVA